MANTWIAVNPMTDEVLSEFRSYDLDIAELYDKHGLPIDIFDKTDRMRFVGSIVEEHTGLAPLIRLKQREDDE